MNIRNSNTTNIITPFIIIIVSLLFYLSPLYFRYFPFFIIFFPLSLAPLMIGFYKYRLNFIFYIILFLIVISIILLYPVLINKKANIQLGLFLNNLLAYLLFLVIPSFIFGYGLQKNYSLQTIYSMYLYYVLLLIAGILLLMQTDYFSGKVSYFFTQFDNQFSNYIAELKANKISEEIIQQQIANKILMINLIKNYYPALLFIVFVLYFTINITISIVIISRYFVKKPVFLNIFTIKVNEHIIWIFILSWTLLFIFLNLHLEKFTRIAWNISIIVSTLYFLQGASIFLLKFLFFNIPFWLKVILLFIIFYISLRFIIISAIIFMGIGLLDLWLDFRKFLPPENIDKLA